LPKSVEIVCLAAQLFNYSGIFTFVLEEDGSVLDGDVLDAVFDNSEKIGSVMALQSNEQWTPCKQYSS
jgi:hypothetical protein